MNKQYIKRSLEYLLDYNNYLAAGLWGLGTTKKVEGMYVAKYHPNSELRTIWPEARLYKTSWVWVFERGLSVLPLGGGRVELLIRENNRERNISNYFEDPHNITEGEVELFSTVEGGEVPFLLCIYEWLIRMNSTQKINS